MFPVRRSELNKLDQVFVVQIIFDGETEIKTTLAILNQQNMLWTLPFYDNIELPYGAFKFFQQAVNLGVAVLRENPPIIEDC